MSIGFISAAARREFNSPPRYKHCFFTVVYYVYILFSISYRKTYVGYTSDLNSRLASHNTLAPKGFTIHFRPWILIHVEEFETKGGAVMREKELKSGKGREFIKNILKKNIHERWIGSSTPPPRYK